MTWTIKNGLQNANCIRTYFHIKNEVQRIREKYLYKYKIVPTFRAAFHCGKVIRGEIGEVKSQIVFHGEPLYTTSEVEKLCSTLEKDILVTSELIQRISLPVIYEMKLIGTKQVLERDLDLYTINELELKSS